MARFREIVQTEERITKALISLRGHPRRLISAFVVRMQQSQGFAHPGPIRLANYVSLNELKNHNILTDLQMIGNTSFSTETYVVGTQNNLPMGALCVAKGPTLPQTEN